MAKPEQHSSKAVSLESPIGSFSSTYTAVSSFRGRHVTVEDYTTDEIYFTQLCDSPESIESDAQIVTPEEEIECLVLDNDPSTHKASTEKSYHNVSYSLDACTKKLQSGNEIIHTEPLEETTGTRNVEGNSDSSASGFHEFPAVVSMRLLRIHGR